MLALTLYTLTSRVITSRTWCAAVAFVASQPALLYAYSLWGGIKEIVAAALLALVAALVAAVLRGDNVLRPVIPLAVASAAVLDALSAGGIVWLVPLLAAAAVAVVSQRGIAYAA